MPLYVGDYLADTGRLTTEQPGAYLLLILDYWRNGALPDDSILATICGLSATAWSMHSAMHLANGLNATKAAISAGYSKKTAASIGEENLRKP
jgi:hypothetical protein